MQIPQNVSDFYDKTKKDKEKGKDEVPPEAIFVCDIVDRRRTKSSPQKLIIDKKKANNYERILSGADRILRELEFGAIWKDRNGEYHCLTPEQARLYKYATGLVSTPNPALEARMSAAILEAGFWGNQSLRISNIKINPSVQLEEQIKVVGKIDKAYKEANAGSLAYDSQSKFFVYTKP